MTESELSVVYLAMKVAAWSVMASFLPAVAVAFVLARWRSPMAGVARGVVMLPLVLPPIVTGYLLLTVLGRTSFIGRTWHALTGGHLAYSTAACVIAASVVGFPLFVESARLSLVAVDPRLELVSRSLGRGRAATFWRVTLPLAAPGVMAGAALCFARALGEFGATIVFAGNIEGETRQIPLAVYTLLNQPGSEERVWWLVGISAGFSFAALSVSTLLNRRRRRDQP